jgi:hypothetical protein
MSGQLARLIGLVMLSVSCTQTAPFGDAGEQQPDAERSTSSQLQPAVDVPRRDDEDAGSGADQQDASARRPELDAGTSQSEILTQRYNNARTGANLDEHVLTRDNVGKLSLIGSWSIEAEVYAQVLVAAGVEIAGAKHAVAIVATMNNTLYAFDADAVPADAFLWRQGLNGELGLPAFCSRNIAGPNGILSTPVIDKARGHVYVVSRDCDPRFPPDMPQCQQRLFQIALATGEVLQSTAIAGEVSVVDDNGRSHSTRFEPSVQWNRPGLLLHNDALVIAFGSGPAGDQHEEDYVYHGWAFRYRVGDLKRAPEVFCTTPRGRGGSVWQSGAAPAADDDAVYLTGANGIQMDSSIHPPGEWPTSPIDHEDSVIRLPLDAWSSVKAYWDDRSYIQAGNVFQHMESGDNGFGSSGPMLIPDTRLMLVGSKAGLVYLIDRDAMRAVQEPLSPFTDLALQPGHHAYLHSWWGIPMITQSFVFYRPKADKREGYAYAWAANDRLRQLRFDYEAARIELAASADVPAVLGGGNVVLSANGDAADSGVLWATTRAGDGTGGPEGTLWAFDPETLKVLLRLDTPAWSKFNPPTVVRGRVFVPSTAPAYGTQQVLVYALRAD